MAEEKANFIIAFIHVGKEAHTSSMVQHLSSSFLHRSLCSFTRFLGKNVWTVERLLETAFNSSSLSYGLKPIRCFFLAWMTLLSRRQAKRFQDVPGIKTILKTWPMSFNTNGSSLLYKDFLLPLWAKFYHPKETRGLGPCQNLGTVSSAYQRVSLFLYGKNRNLRVARFIGLIQGRGKVAVVVSRSPLGLVCEKIHSVKKVSP